MLTAHNTVDRVMTPERLDAHRLIEEFMILANVAAAETLERARVPLIYRVHDEPDPERVNALRDFLQSLDISFSKGGALRAEHFNRIGRYHGRASARARVPQQLAAGRDRVRWARPTRAGTVPPSRPDHPPPSRPGPAQRNVPTRPRGAAPLTNLSGGLVRSPDSPADFPWRASRSKRTVL